MNKKVKIRHSGFSDHCWYNKFVGQDFELITEDADNYWVKTGDKMGSIEKVDGEIIEEEIDTRSLKNDLLTQQKNEAEVKAYLQKEKPLTYKQLSGEEPLPEHFKPTKQTEGKLFWEMNWDYLEGVAKRMQANKGDKYEKFAWKKGVDVDEINQAILRHTIEIMKGNTIDGSEYGHYEALCCNAMLAVHELKRLKNK